MRRFLIALFFFVAALPAHAWNAAGHRLVAVIAWQQLSPPARTAISAALARHPDHPHWQASTRSSDAGDLFAEAATWPDDIRNDPRFYDEERDPPTPALPGLPDTARHKRWHYVDLDAAGKVQSGELDRQIERLSKLLTTSRNAEQITYALPWLLHLVGDIHQPLHVGRHGDEGGNQVEIENPFNKRLPFSSLHLYWDDLPGPPWLRGQRLDDMASRLLARYAAPEQGSVSRWRQESHDLLATAYPAEQGSLLPIASEDFQRASRDTANRRLVEAGYRLGRLLDGIFGAPTSGVRP
ncbi:MAG TPA: S1/P1 nuclease [Azonexus sp.]|nr:S1/P1 nuclease [Azonexus sp.]